MPLVLVRVQAYSSAASECCQIPEGHGKHEPRQPEVADVPHPRPNERNVLWSKHHEGHLAFCVVGRHRNHVRGIRVGCGPAEQSIGE
eukprot:2520935-Amphidinium_carterae.2